MTERAGIKVSHRGKESRGRSSDKGTLAGGPVFHPYAEMISDTDRRFLRTREIKKQPYFLAALKAANLITSDLMRHAGVSPLEVQTADIYLLPEEAFKTFLGEDADAQGTDYAITDHRTRSIFACPERQTGKVEMCQTVFHEICHLKSYSAVESVVGEDGVAFFKRLGYKVFRTKKREKKDLPARSFVGFDEAVTAKLEMNYLPRLLSSHSTLRKLKKGNEELKRKVSEREDLPMKEIAWVDAKGEQYSCYSYRSQRLVLDFILDVIHRDNAETFRDVDDVFNKIVVPGYFNGQVLPLGRHIAHSFGDSAFRMLGAMTRDPNSARLILDVLKGLRREHEKTKAHFKD